MNDVGLQRRLRQTLETLWARFPLGREQIAVSWRVYDDRDASAAASARAGYREDVPVYPASVIKLCYLAHAHAELDAGRLADTPELARALRGMIVDSSNDATALVVDLLSATTGGPSLSADAMRVWARRRNASNRFLRSLGWPEIDAADVNVNQKTWSDGPYGRENDFVGADRANRNRFTTAAAARLLDAIIHDRVVTSERCAAMRALLARDLTPAARADVADGYDQIDGFFGAGLPSATRFWSKAGETSAVCHDAAYVDAPGAPPFVLVAFTEGERPRRFGALPWLAGALRSRLVSER